MKEFEAAFNDKTKIFIINNPQNPTGKVLIRFSNASLHFLQVFSRKELEQIAEVVKKFPHVTVVSDDVYEWMTYDDAEMIRFDSAIVIRDIYHSLE